LNCPTVVERRINSGRLFQDSGPLIEKARFPNFRQNRTQMKSPLEADRRLCLDKMEEQGVTMEDILAECGDELYMRKPLALVC